MRTHFTKWFYYQVLHKFCLWLSTWKRKTPRIILWNTLESRFVVVHWLFSCRQMFPWTGFTPHFGSRPTFIKTAYWRRIWHPPDIGYKRFIPSDKQPGICHLAVDVGKLTSKAHHPRWEKTQIQLWQQSPCSVWGPGGIENFNNEDSGEHWSLFWQMFLDLSTVQALEHGLANVSIVFVLWVTHCLCQ